MNGRAGGLKERFYPESRLAGFSRVDGTVAFYSQVQGLLNPESVVCDFGCGRGAYGEDPVAYRRDLRIFKGKAARVIGLDVDEAGAGNPFMDEFYRLDGPSWPLADESLDVLVCDSVVEHLEVPLAFFREAQRCLRAGGALCIRTPNLWGYPALIGRIAPNRSHTGILQKVKEQTRSEDVFPTFYRCNTIPAIRRAMGACGFEAVVYGFGPEPAYLSFSTLAYRLGVWYQRLAPNLLQPVIFAFGRKTEAGR
jgi:SAM-dependent methyltransferase